jgi:hypothetical protein
VLHLFVILQYPKWKQVIPGTVFHMTFFKKTPESLEVDVPIPFLKVLLKSNA